MAIILFYLVKCEVVNCLDQSIKQYNIQVILIDF